MLFKQKSCPTCGQNYDPALQICPHCQSDNEDFKDKHISKGATFVPWHWQLIYVAIGTVGLYIVSFIITLIAALITKDTNILNAIVNYSVYLLLGAIFTPLLIIFAKSIWKTFTKWQTYVFGILIGVGMVLFSMLYTYLISLTGFTAVNDNEQTVENITKNYPILAVIVIGLIGPLCEEATYRLGLFSFCSRVNRIFAYIINGLIFGFIHFNFSNITSPVEWLMLPDYIISGVVLALAYDFFGFGCSYIAHATNNIISVVSTIIFGIVMVH